MIKIDNLTMMFDQKVILDQISLQLNEGELTSIIGPNGAGKSTLLKAILNLLPSHKGIISYQGSKENSEHNELVQIQDIPIKKLAQLFAYIPQENIMQFDYIVEEIILMGRFPWLDNWERYTKADYCIIEEYIEQLKLKNLIKRKFNQLSGGEKQRVLLAKALVQNTQFIFLDETLSFLDINHQIEIMSLLKEINDKQGKTIIIVSHNINLSIEFSDRLIALKQGHLIGDGQARNVINQSFIKELFDIDIHLIENPYTHKPNLLYHKQTSND